VWIDLEGGQRHRLPEIHGVHGRREDLRLTERVLDLSSADHLETTERARDDAASGPCPAVEGLRVPPRGRVHEEVRIEGLRPHRLRLNRDRPYAGSSRHRSEWGSFYDDGQASTPVFE